MSGPWNAPSATSDHQLELKFLELTERDEAYRKAHSAEASQHLEYLTKATHS